MGVVYRARLVVGVRWDDVVLERVSEQVVTKYDVDTGVPSRHKCMVVSEFVGEEVVDAREFLADHGMPEDPADGKVGVIDIGGELFIGVCVVMHELGYGGVDEKCFSLDEFEVEIDRVSDVLAGVDCVVTPRVFFLTSVS